GVLALGAQRLPLRPREVLAAPQALERVVGDIGEAVVQTEHVLAAYLARNLAEPGRPPFSRGLPRGPLRIGELFVDGRVGKALESVARADPLAGHRRSR